MSSVEFLRVNKSYGHKQVLSDVNMAIDSKTFAVVFGPPGCGKSVILRLLTGLEHPTSGTILMRGVDVTAVSPAERNIGYVPQSFALYPHYSVYQNIAYPLSLMGANKQETDRVVRRAAEMLRIERLLQKRPDQLSGGEKQRVALARGIAKPTDIYVLDDPLTGLDFKLREQLFDDLRNLQVELQAAFIYTTSDPLETLILAQQVYVIDKGRVIESGPLESVYAEPKHLRTMELLGFPRTNLLEGEIQTRNRRTVCVTKLFELPVTLRDTVPDGQKVLLAMRPQDLELDPRRVDGSAKFGARVVLQEDLGGELVVYLESGDIQLTSVVRHDDAHVVGDGNVQVGVPSPAIVVYNPEKGQRIGQGAA